MGGSAGDKGGGAVCQLPASLCLVSSVWCGAC